MSRGRKRITVSADSGWGTVFYNSVGTYVQLINNKLSEKFKKKPLSNYIKILGGYSFKTSEYTKQGVPIIRISDFNNEKVNLDEIVYYPESNKLKKFELVEGDIIIALTGGTIAKLGIVQEGLGKLYLNQRVGKFHILNPKLFEKEYVYWIARSVQSIIKNLAWGAAIPNVSPKQIEKLEFPIPHRDIQKGIIRFLNDLKDENINTDSEYFDFSAEQEIILLQKNQILADSLSKELFNQIDIVKKLRQQILQEAIQGKLVSQDPNDEPASVLLEKIKAEKEKLIKEKKLKKSKPLLPVKEEEIPFEIPKNWVWCRFGDIALIESNLVSPFDYPKSPHIAPNNIEKNTGKLLEIRTVKEDEVKSANHYFFKGQLIYSKVRPKLNKVVEVDFEGLCSADMYPLKSLIHNRYLLYTMLSDFFLLEVDKFDNRVKMPKINQNQLNKILFPLAPISEQINIAIKIDSMLKVSEELEKEIKQNQNLTQQLLQSALKEALKPKVN